MQAVPQLSNIRQVSDGWIKKYVLAYTMPDGSTYEYESASRKSLEAYRAELEGNAAGRACAADAVCIVPQTATGELLLIREFRYPLNSWCIAFPAGLMEPGEDLATCVDRELREETGYALRADAEKYKAEAAQARKDADERVAAVQFDGKLDAAITAAHGRSAKAIRALLDVDTLKGSDKQDEAITAALAALQKDSGYLFESGETPPPYAAGTGSTALHGADADTAMRQAMGLPIDD